MRIKTKSLLLFLLLLPFFKPEYINLYSNYSLIFDTCKIISAVYCLFLIIREKSVTKDLIPILFFCVYLIVVTVLSSGSFFSVMKFSATIVSLGILINMNKKNIRSFVSVSLLCFEIFIYLNFVSILLYPDGLYSTGTIYTGIATQNWILGFKNTQIVYFLPALVLSRINYHYTHKRTRYYALNCCIIISTLLIQSTTTTVAYLVYLLVILLSKNDRFAKMFTLNKCLIASAVVFIALIILQKLDIFIYFATFAGKSSTFLNRVAIWDVTLQQVMKSPIWGHGWQSESVRHIMYGNNSSIVHAHNMILEELYLGGVIFIAFKLYFYSLFNRKIKQIKNDSIVKDVLASFICMEVLGISEFYINPLLYYVVIIMMYINYIVGEENDHAVECYNTNL